MTPEQRKKRTEAILQEKDIPFLDALPCVEGEQEVELRTTDEMGKRIICLFCYASTGFNPDNQTFSDYLQEYELWQYLSKEERSFLSHPVGHEQARVNATWRMEALYLLMWSANFIQELPWPEKESSLDDFIPLMPQLDESPWTFINNLTLRSVAEIMDASDLIYRLHWALRSYGKNVPLSQDVIQEWHHAVNWLTNYDGENWDWVGTDT